MRLLATVWLSRDAFAHSPPLPFSPLLLLPPTPMCHERGSEYGNAPPNETSLHPPHPTIHRSNPTWTQPLRPLERATWGVRERRSPQTSPRRFSCRFGETRTPPRRARSVNQPLSSPCIPASPQEEGQNTLRTERGT